MNDLINHFNEILPLAAKWAEEQEIIILDKGVSLNVQLFSTALDIGVNHPEKVRILFVPQIPVPTDPILNAACKQTRLISTETIGLTLRYGIFVRSDYENDSKVYIHELVHVAQYERLGGISQFLKQYLYEVITIGYPQAPMEQEAIMLAKSKTG